MMMRRHPAGAASRIEVPETKTASGKDSFDLGVFAIGNSRLRKRSPKPIRLNDKAKVVCQLGGHFGAIGDMQMILRVGSWARIRAGTAVEAIMDFKLRGGAQITRRECSPLMAASKAAKIAS